MNMKHLIIGIAAFAGATSAWGIHEDRPAGTEFKLEQSQEQVAQEQAYQGRLEASGAVPIRTQEQEDIKVSKEASAKAALSAADRMAQGSENLKKAEEGMKAAGTNRKSSSQWWFFALLAGVGLMAYVGIKDWMSKNIPDMPAKRR